MVDSFIQISIQRQTLELWQRDTLLQRWPVSTALKGVGSQSGSYQTPLGLHRIRACIGAGAPLNSVFRGRRATGEIYNEDLARAHPDRDWILTRILWLCGEEKGLNRGGNVDSQRRYIYIHGTPDTEPMGVPRSHGCIRMTNQDVVALFSQVQPGIPVRIKY
ncbi:MAG: L,D-transpeptidase [Ketobacter sp.]|nr:MAG: L,D-transpeptidase [Ketobacter sp.]